MSNMLKQIWHLLKNQPDILFFYMFLTTSILSVRKVLYFFPINGSFNEYTGAYIYLSDIFLILTFILFILYNNKTILSNIRTILKKLFNNFKMFHVEHFFESKLNNYEKILKNDTHLLPENVPRGTFSLVKKCYAQVVNNYLILFPLFLAIFSFISIAWSINQTVALFRSIKLLELVLLYFYIIAKCSTWNINEKITVKKFSHMLNVNVPRLPRRMFHVEHSYWGGTFIKNIFLIIITIGFIQSIIGVIQFIIQHSIGLFWLKESIISPIILGVAKIILDGHTYIRAYGLFPHPNIFGGYLAFSILTTILYNKMFHVEHFQGEKENETTAKYKCSTWNICKKNTNINVPCLPRNIVPRGTMLHRNGALVVIILSIQILALILTFSKSAIFGLLIGLFYIYISSKVNNVPRGTLFEKFKITIKMFHACHVGCSNHQECSTWNIPTEVKHFSRKFILICSILILIFIIIKPDTYSFFLKSLQERELYLNVSRGTFLSHPFIGVGAGQFITNMAKNYSLDYWQYQPVHNVFLLVLNEFGIFMMLGFLYFIFKMFHARPVGCSNHKECSTWNIHTGVEHFQIEDSADVPRGTFSNYEIYLKGILVAFIFIMLFDHYFLDIQQGMLLLWLMFGLITGCVKR